LTKFLKKFTMILALEILKRICMNYNVSISDVLGKKQSENVVNARIEACAKLKQFGYSIQEIGEILGKRSKKTILNLLKRSTQ